MASNSVFVIAEAGVNHNGSVSRARELVDVAARSGADAVKFQTFDPGSLVTRGAPTARYQASHGHTSQLQMLSELVLPSDDIVGLKRYAEERGLEFLSTPFDLFSVELLASAGQTTWKISSGDITNVPLIESIARRAHRIILSSGASTLEEIGTALEWIEAAGCSRDRVTVLHCNTEYPTPYHDVNLRAMNHIGRTHRVRIGYSDHTLGIEIPIAAVALGACVIEKHFTVDRKLPGPDHEASLEEPELTAMIHAIRNIEAALGRQDKEVTESEKTNQALVRKAIYAITPIKKGELLTDSNIATKRPEAGIPASEWHRVMGTVASRDFKPDEAIEE